MAAAFAILLAGCAGGRPPEAQVPPNAGVYKVGSPYQIDGTWYYPQEQPDYDETGIASWYGPTFYGKATANGERFDADALTAAHRTLPMPVNVRVTNLANGRSLILRVNDRGPFAKGRIIDVSERAAKLLGFYDTGTARVRVSFVSRADLPGGRPPPSETPIEIASALPAVPAGKVDAGALDIVPGATVAAATPVTAMPMPPPSPSIEPTATQPTGQVTEVPVPAVTRLYVQVGAFSSYENAARLRTRFGSGLEISTIQRNGQTLYRLRSGPFDSTDAADAALARISSLGSNDAQIVVDR